ncbi:calcineurin-like phosphoesterase [Clostridium puniceum]|uniref:Calcineurin-like phosphoesterase n=1 Tax=Clostridium puniceum TaxID=29367 RepID=A0A1S8TMI9_9CLOT|nr:metallophosphoesterase family protein [Clostridium puniceum]OOM78987.1 calcineurin-like phosphoesterase [Clostridium puniceum]
MKCNKKIMIILLSIIILSTNICVVAEANKTTLSSSESWEKWDNYWQIVKNSHTEMSLAPGRDETQLNFAWYSKGRDAKPSLKFGKKNDLSDAREISVTHESATNGYISNKATVTNLDEQTNYYYSYQIYGKWSEAIPYTSRSTKAFTILYVGDPQIGASIGSMPPETPKELVQERAVESESFNWNNTIDAALKANQNVSFMISAGDQVQSGEEKDEIEYTGYLSPTALRSLPVATTIGNHDALSRNYSFHFNNPNASNLGETAAGGDYYYSYGNTLFITLNTNNRNISEHKQLIEKAINENRYSKWRVVTLHQDIYGSGEHSNEPDVVDLRYNLVPILEDNNIDVVLTGHDHVYTRSLMLKGGTKNISNLITEDQFLNYINGKTPIDSKYNDYLAGIEDNKAIENTSGTLNNVVNPSGILYMTADSSSGSKFYGLATKKQVYVAFRYQGNVPTYSIIDVNDITFTINTYRADTGEKIDDTFTITKTK